MDSSGDEKVNDEAAISEDINDVGNHKHKKSRSVSRLVQKPVQQQVIMNKRANVRSSIKKLTNQQK